jgi:O-antigen/teichoic acid export membrane protein
MSVAQIGYSVVMARLLEPKAFGLVAAAQLLMRFGTYFSEMGLSKAIQQKEHLTQRDIRAASTAAIGLGVLFFGIFYLLAPFLANFQMPDPAMATDLSAVLAWLSFNFVILGLLAVPTALLRRHMRFKAVALIDIFSNMAAYLGVGITLGYMGYGVWSLVSVILLQAGLQWALTYMLERHSVVPVFKKDAYTPLLGYGGRMSLISFMEFIAGNLDTLMIGRLKGARALGLYNRAMLTIQLPMQSLTMSLTKVLFPALSSIQSDSARMRSIYLASVQMVGFIIFPICIGVSIAAPQVVLFLLGPKWVESIPILQILAIVVGIKLLMIFGGTVCDATGRLNVKMIIEAFSIALLGIGLYLFHKEPLSHIALVILASELCKKIVYSIVLSRLLHFRLWGDLVMGYVPGLLAAGLTGLALWSVQSVLPQSVLDIPALALVIEMAVAGVALFVAYLLPFSNPIRNEINSRFLGKTALARNPKLKFMFR